MRCQLKAKVQVEIDKINEGENSLRGNQNTREAVSPISEEHRYVAQGADMDGKSVWGENKSIKGNQNTRSRWRFSLNQRSTGM